MLWTRQYAILIKESALEHKKRERKRKVRAREFADKTTAEVVYFAVRVSHDASTQFYFGGVRENQHS